MIMHKLNGTFKTLWQKGMLHILTGSFLSKLVGFFGSIFVVRILSKSDYGILGYIENLYGYIYIFAGMGLSNAILRYVVLGKTKQEKYQYFSYAYKMSIIWNILLVVIADIVCLFYPHPDVYSKYSWLCFVMAIMLPFQYLVDNVLSNERAMFANKKYAVLSFVLSVSIVINKMVFAYIEGIAGIVISQVILYVFLAFIFLYQARKKYYGNCISANLPKAKKYEVNIYSFQYMITNGLWALFMLNDVFLLGKFCTPESVAEYKVAYTIPGSIALISTSIGIFVAPYFIKHQEDYVWIKNNYLKAFFGTAFVIGILCLFIGIIAKPIVWLLYGKKYLNIVKVMRLLLLTSFCNCGLRYTTANILAAMGQIKYNMCVSIGSMFLQIVINLYMIPKLGIIGAAITSFMIYGFMAVCLFIIFFKKYLHNRVRT